MAKNEAKVAFKAETKEFDKQIKKSSQAINGLKSQMNLADATFKNTGEKAQYLAERQRNLSNQLAQNRSKQLALNQSLQAAVRLLGEDSREAGKLSQQLVRTKTQEQNLLGQLKQATTEINNQKNGYNNLNSEIRKQESLLATLENDYKNLIVAGKSETSEANSLKEKIKTLNTSLQDNKQKISEADMATEELARETLGLEKAVENVDGGLRRSDIISGNILSNAYSRIAGVAKSAAREIIQTGKGFETSMSKVSALSGATGDEYEALEAKAREMGATTTFSASEAADALGYMALAGWDTQSMMAGIPGVLSLAQAGEMDLAAASDLVTDYLSAFNMKADDTGRMVDVLAYAQANANTTTEGLGAAFKNCAANANAAGLDVETTSAAISMMANQGLKGSEAGTALNAVMRDMTARMKDGAIEIGKTKVAVQDSEGNYRDFVDIIGDIEKATNGMGDAQKASALQSTFTADSIKGLNLLLNSGAEELGSFRGELKRCDGAAKTTADTMTDNLGGDIAEFNSALEETELQLYDSLQEPLRAIVQLGTGPFMSMLQGAVGNLDKIVPAAIAVSTAMAISNQRMKFQKRALEEAGIATDGMTRKEIALTAAKNKSALASERKERAERGVAKAQSMLGSAGVMIAVTALTEVITFAVEAYQKAEEHTRKYQGATKGLEDAATGLTVKLDEETGALESVSDAASSIDMEEVIQEHLDLANSISELKQETTTSVDTLEGYKDSIENLAGKKATPENMAALQSAIDGVNKSCGTNYTVTKNSAGALEVQAKGAKVAKDAILDLIDAEELKIKKDAIQEQKKDLYAQKKKDAESYTEQLKKVNEMKDRQKELDDWLSQSHPEASQDEINAMVAQRDTLSASIANEQTKLEELEGVLGSTESSYNRITEQETLCNMAMQEGASEMLKAAEANETFKSNVQGAGADLVAFTGFLEDMGFTADDIADMSAEDSLKIAQQWQQAANECGGNVEMMKAMIQGYNNTPILDKNGKVTADATQLMDAKGNIYKWNGTKLLNKENKVVTKVKELTDAQGNIVEWNKSTLVPKDAKASADFKQLKDANDEVKQFRSLPKNLGTKSATLKLFKTTIVSSKGSSKKTESARGGIFPDARVAKHASGFFVDRPTTIGYTGDVAHIAGEAGLEYVGYGEGATVLPLTDPKMRPWARAVAQEMGPVPQPVSTGSRNVNITMNITVQGSMDGKAADDLAKKVRRAVRMGVR